MISRPRQSEHAMGHIESRLPTLAVLQRFSRVFADCSVGLSLVDLIALPVRKCL